MIPTPARRTIPRSLATRCGLAAAAAALAGCAPMSIVVLDFPENLYLTRSVTSHGVTLHLEFPEPREDDTERPILTLRGGSTLYTFGDAHEIELRYQNFIVGDQRFPTGANADLYVFLARDGPWRFRYFDQLIEVERSGRWKPALYRRSVIARTPANPGAGAGDATSHIDHEELRVGRFTIVFRPDAPHWQVNGLAVEVDPRRKLVLHADGSVSLTAD